MAEFVAALVIALVVGGIFAALGARGPWGGAFWFFLILFFATWAIALWVRPVGPAYWGVYWVIFFAIAIGIALLLAATTPRHTSAGVTERPPEVTGDRAPEETPTERTLSKPAAGIGIAFWILLLFFLVLIILGYAF